MAAISDNRMLKFPATASSPIRQEAEALTAMKNDAVFISGLTRAISSCKTQNSGDFLAPNRSQELAISLLSLDEKEFLADPVQSGSSWGIRVVDETALIGGSVSVPKSTKISDENPVKRPRKRPAREPRKVKKAVYSRKTMEALRFAGVSEQTAMWKDVHLGLGPTVRKEYDDLLVCSSKPEKSIRLSFDHAHLGGFSGKKDQSPSIFGVFGGKERAKAVDVSVN